ncbi:MAG: hypothetical protein IBJ07_08875 [Rhizobiaceae bacterium]|nr:hypothetical protein [Rhizobiaceae bacterium]
MSLDLDPSVIWRDFTTDGIPASGPWEPRKVDIRQSLSALRQAVIALLADADPGLALPNLLIRATDTGAGTPNAIQATTNVPIPAGDATALIALNIFESNAGSPVTVALNGSAPLTIKTNSGNDVVAEGLAEGMLVLGMRLGSTFRIVTDQVSASIVAAAEAAQAAAEAAQAAAEAAAAGVNLPAIDADDAGLPLIVNPAGDGYAVGSFPGASVATRAALAALDTSENSFRFLTEPGREGPFVLREGDYSAAVTADVAEGVFVAADDAPATEKVWARVDTTFLHPLMFGAEGQSDCTQAFRDCLAAADYLGKPMHILDRSLSYPIQAGTNFAAIGRTIIGVGMPVIQMLGSGRGFSMDGSAGVDAYKNSMQVSNLVIEGSPAITDGFYCYGAVQGSSFTNIRVRECSNIAFNIINGVAAQYAGLTCSTNIDRTMTAIPLYGLVLDGVGTGNYTADCKFAMPIFEGLDTGIRIMIGSGNLFEGGTSEANATGIDINSHASNIRNKFVGIWCEGNSYADAVVRGKLNSFDACHFQSAGSLGTVNIPSGQATRFRDSYIRWANLQGPSAQTLFDGCEFSDNGSLGITGSGTYRTFGCVKTNTSGAITSIIPDS